MRIRNLLRLAAAALLAWALPAQATWLRASSTHFVIYSDTSEQRLREQAVELERVDAMLRFFHATKERPDAVFNKVTIYVVPDVSTIRRLSRDSEVAGFYLPRVTGSIAFTPRAAGSGNVLDLSPRIVLYHEYAHHFLMGNYAVAYPAWFAEGYAEFASTMMKKDGYYWLGAAANHRAYGLMTTHLSARQLFDPPAKMSPEQREAIYGRGWLLTHYILFNPERRKQFAMFVDLYNRGIPSLEAGTKAFGDLKALDRDLDRYMEKDRIPAIRLEPERLGDPAVEIAPLSAGEAAMIALRMQSTAGVDSKTAPPLYARAAPVAARFPADPMVQGWFAEMALDAGELDAADRAADAGIAADSKSSQALLYKARVQMRRALKDKVTDMKPWDEARRYIIRANRAQPDDAAALALFYQSFQLQDVPPRQSAKDGLYRAAVLVPQDSGLRFAVARQQILDKDIDGAKASLRVLAANPHAGTDNPATRLIAALEAGKTGEDALAVLRDDERTTGGGG